MPIGFSEQFETNTISVYRASSLLQTPAVPFPVDAAAGQDDTQSVVPGCEDIPCNIQPEHGNPGIVADERVLRIDTAIYFTTVLPIKSDDLVIDQGSDQKYIVRAIGDEASTGRLFWIFAERLV